jgi:hypothetical protein
MVGTEPLIEGATPSPPLRFVLAADAKGGIALVPVRTVADRGRSTCSRGAGRRRG